MRIGLQHFKNICVNYSLKFNRSAYAIGITTHYLTLGWFTPLLTTESRRLFDKTRPGDRIEVKQDGFYRCNNGSSKKIAGNGFISDRIMRKGLPRKFMRTQTDSPEQIAAYCRSSFVPNPLKWSYVFGLGLATADLTIKHLANKFIPLSRELYESWSEQRLIEHIPGPENNLIINSHHTREYMGLYVLMTSFILTHLIKAEQNIYGASRLRKTGFILLLGGIVSNGGEHFFKGYGTNYLRIFFDYPFHLDLSTNLGDVYLYLALGTLILAKILKR